MQAGWFGSNAGKLLLAGLFSFVVVGLLCVQWLNAERRQVRAAVDQGVRTSRPGFPEPKPAPAPKGAAEHATPVDPQIRTAEPGPPGPKQGPVLEDLAEHTATIGQQARTAGPAPAESRQAMPAAAADSPAGPAAPVGRQAAAAEPAIPERKSTAAVESPAGPAPGPQAGAAEPTVAEPKQAPASQTSAEHTATVDRQARATEPGSTKPALAPVRKRTAAADRQVGTEPANAKSASAPAPVRKRMAAVDRQVRAAEPASAKPVPAPVRENRTVRRKPGGSGAAAGQASPARLARAPAVADHAPAGTRTRTSRLGRGLFPERGPAWRERQPQPVVSLRRRSRETASPGSYPLANGLGWVEERRL